MSIDVGNTRYGEFNNPNTVLAPGTLESSKRIQGVGTRNVQTINDSGTGQAIFTNSVLRAPAALRYLGVGASNLEWQSFPITPTPPVVTPRSANIGVGNNVTVIWGVETLDVMLWNYPTTPNPSTVVISNLASYAMMQANNGGTSNSGTLPPRAEAFPWEAYNTMKVEVVGTTPIVVNKAAQATVSGTVQGRATIMLRYNQPTRPGVPTPGTSYDTGQFVLYLGNAANPKAIPFSMSPTHGSLSGVTASLLPGTYDRITAETPTANFYYDGLVQLLLGVSLSWNE